MTLNNLFLSLQEIRKYEMADAPTILSGGDQLHLAPEADHIPIVQVEPTWKASVSQTGEFVRAQVHHDLPMF